MRIKREVRCNTGAIPVAVSVIFEAILLTTVCQLTGGKVGQHEPEDLPL